MQEFRRAGSGGLLQPPLDLRLPHPLSTSNPFCCLVAGPLRRRGATYDYTFICVVYFALMTVSENAL